MKKEAAWSFKVFLFNVLTVTYRAPFFRKTIKQFLFRYPRLRYKLQTFVRKTLEEKNNRPIPIKNLPPDAKKIQWHRHSMSVQNAFHELERCYSVYKNPDNSQR